MEKVPTREQVRGSMSNPVDVHCTEWKAEISTSAIFALWQAPEDFEACEIASDAKPSFKHMFSSTWGNFMQLWPLPSFPDRLLVGFHCALNDFSFPVYYSITCGKLMTTLYKSFATCSYKNIRSRKEFN